MKAFTASYEYTVMAMVRNAIKCKKCGMVLESKHRHDLVSCPCGVFVDGGHDYRRIGWPGGELSDWVEVLHESAGDLVSMDELTKRSVLPEMRKADEIAALTGLPIQLTRQNLQEWKASARIFSVEENGTEYFPLFALDPSALYHPYPAVAEILRILGAALSPWGIAGWFVGLNSFLDDQRPQDLLAVNPAWAIDAAKDAADEM